MKVITTFYRRMILFQNLLSDDMPARETQLPIEIKPLTHQDLAAYQHLRPDQNLRDIQARLNRSDRCFCCWYQGQIVDAGWVANGQQVYIPYLNRAMVLDPGDLYNYDIFTHPNYRGHRLYAARSAFVSQYTWQEGFRRHVRVIAAENYVSLAASAVLGHESIGQYSCLRLGFCQLDWHRQWGEVPLLPLIESLS
jgi:hypothetical protein